MADADGITRMNAALEGRYRIERELGAGGMATVYLADDVRHGRRVAVKVLRAELAHAMGTERFLREIETVAGLSHPHVVPLFDSGEADGLLFYVMPYVEDDTLRERLERAGSLPLEDALRITDDVADALEHAHERGVIHRDLKPANILFMGGHAAVADFGIARAVESAADEEVLTRTGVSVGSIGYMSPEQAAGDQGVDERTDVYALGCLLYEMLAGERAFRGPTPQAVLARQLTEGPPTLSVVRTGVPSGVEKVIAKALAPNRADRFASISELRESLQGASVGDGDHQSRRLSRKVTRRRVLFATGAAVALAAVAFAAFGSLPSDAALDASTIRSLAVLPLENLSGDPDQDYFANQMHDALGTQLSQIGSLTVIPRTSTLRYQETDLSVPEIATELGVDGLIEGTVAQYGADVRVTVTMIHGETGRRVSTRTYERELRDVLALQEEIARDVAEDIQVTLSPDRASRLSGARTVDPQAYRLWARGNELLTELKEEAFREALRLYQEAVEIDPTFAEAHAGAAMAYLQLAGWHASTDPAEILPLARRSAARAIALDSTVAEGHLALAHYRRLFEWDWEGAARSFERGLELNPSAIMPRIEYANFLTSMGRFEESIEVGERTLQLAPLSPPAYNELGFAHWLAGDLERAESLYLEGLEVDPAFSQSHFLLGTLYAEQGDSAKALRHLERMPLEELSATNLGHTAGAYAVAGRPDVARRVRARLEALGDSVPVAPMAFASVHLGLDEREEALAWIRRAFDDRDPSIVWLKVVRDFDPLRSDPRFQDIIRRMSFPE